MLRMPPARGVRDRPVSAHRAGRDRRARGRAGLCPQTRGHLQTWLATGAGRELRQGQARLPRGRLTGNTGQGGRGLRGSQLVVATGPSSSGRPCGGPSGGQSVLCLVCRLLVGLSGCLWDPRTHPGAGWHMAWSRLGHCPNPGECRFPLEGCCAQAGAAAVGPVLPKAIGGRVARKPAGPSPGPWSGLAGSLPWGAVPVGSLILQMGKLGHTEASRHRRENRKL